MNSHLNWLRMQKKLIQWMKICGNDSENKKKTECNVITQTHNPRCLANSKRAGQQEISC